MLVRSFLRYSLQSQESFFLSNKNCQNVNSHLFLVIFVHGTCDLQKVDCERCFREDRNCILIVWLFWYFLLCDE
jgi:hypothetical protein